MKGQIIGEIRLDIVFGNRIRGLPGPSHNPYGETQADEKQAGGNSKGYFAHELDAFAQEETRTQAVLTIMALAGTVVKHV
jgi:hypothetical protein